MKAISWSHSSSWYPITIMSSAVIMTLSVLRNIVSNFLWKMSPATVALNGITVSLNWLISVLKVIKKLYSSSNGHCQYHFEQSNNVMTVAPDSLCPVSSGVQKQCGSWMLALLRLVWSRQMCSLDFPVLLSFVSTNMKTLMHGIASWTGLIPQALSILLISYLKVSLRYTSIGLQGVWFCEMGGSALMWYGSPGNLPIPSKSSGYCSLICSLVLTILIFLGVSSHCIMGLLCAIIGPELATVDPKWASSVPCYCFMDSDSTCTSFLG